MDFARDKTKQELEDALFQWEENRFQDYPLPPESVLDLMVDSQAGLKPRLQEAIRELQEMDWLLDPDSPTLDGSNFSTASNFTLHIHEGDCPIAGYRLIKKIGRGSFGEVWEARGPGEVSLAMKIIPMTSGLDVVEIRSLELLKSIRHPHLLSIFGYWITGECLWIAMELAQGHFLDYANHVHPPENKILTMFGEAAEAIDFLNQKQHDAGDGKIVSILHRDIKPQNMLIVGGALKIGDFGLARILDEEKNQHSGCMTPGYSPPEFFHEKMSASSDQYSLAITWCKIIGGSVPFTGNAAEIMAGHCNRPPDLSMIPLHQQWVVAKALEKNPLKRWESCSEFVRQIAKANSDPKARLPSPNRRYVLTWVSSLGLGLMVILLVFLRFHGRQQTPTFEEIILQGHLDEVSCTCVSEDGKIGISGGKDKQVILWDLENQKSKFIFNDHTKTILSADISKDGQQALTGGALLDNRIILWDLAKGEKTRELTGHQHGVRSVRFLPDGKRAISCSFDCTARLWNLETGAQIHFFEHLDTFDPRNLQVGSPRQVWHMDVSDDGSTMVCCLRDGKICLYDVESGKRTKVINGPDQVYSSFSMNAGGTMGVTSMGGSSQSLREMAGSRIFKWDLISGKKEVLMETENPVRALMLAKNTNDLFVFPRQGQPSLFNLVTKNKTDILGNLESNVSCISGNYEGTKLLLGCKDFSVRFLKRN